MHEYPGLAAAQKLIEVGTSAFTADITSLQHTVGNLVQCVEVLQGHVAFTLTQIAGIVEQQQQTACMEAVVQKHAQDIHIVKAVIKPKLRRRRKVRTSTLSATSAFREAAVKVQHIDTPEPAKSLEVPDESTPTINRSTIKSLATPCKAHARGPKLPFQSPPQPCLPTCKVGVLTTPVTASQSDGVAAWKSGQLPKPARMKVAEKLALRMLLPNLSRNTPPEEFVVHASQHLERLLNL